VKTVTPGACLPRPLGPDFGGRVTGAPIGGVMVIIVEATAEPCDCSRPGRAVVAPDEIAAVREELVPTGVCAGSTGISCSDYCGCRILELAGSSSEPTSPLYACQNQTTVTDASLVGYCYIDLGHVDENGMPAPIGNPELVADCAPTQQQRIRFIGADTPLPGANVFLVAGSAPNPAP
jgi:hypothetical protein